VRCKCLKRKYLKARPFRRAASSILRAWVRAPAFRDLQAGNLSKVQEGYGFRWIFHI
jgi:hypothetical protein